MMGLTLALAALAAPGRADVVDGIQAVVADKVVTFAQVEDYTRPVEETLRTQYASDPATYQLKLDAALHDSLELLVERALILHNYETGGYSQLPDSLADQLVEDNIHQHFGDRITMLKTLQAQGMTLEQYRKELLDRYIESGLRNENVQKTVIISPYKIEAYYHAHPDEFQVPDQVKLRMIVLNKSSDADTATPGLAAGILRRFQQGTGFAVLAKLYSQGSQAHPDGEWGWIDRTMLRKELSDAAFALPPGHVSPVVDTPEAVYLMQVEDRQAAHLKPLPEVRDEIERKLQADEQARLSKAWIDGLKKKTYIRYFFN